MSKFKYLYGSVSSWRLGRSLGVDLISGYEKICSFNCIYCQIGKTEKLTLERKVFVPTSKILEEIKRIPEIEIDYITFSGMGEPTLAKNIGEVIRAIKKLRKEPVAVLTNASLIDDPQVREDLLAADKVIAKLDAATQSTFEKVSCPVPGMKLADILKGLVAFRKMYKGSLALQMMFVEANFHEARELSELARLIKPDEIELNTPLRKCNVEPLPRKKLNEIQKYFKGYNVKNVYDGLHKDAVPIEDDKMRRRRLGK